MEENKTEELQMETVIKISVRNLVEFILRAGDINSGTVGMADKDAMQKGSKLHRKIQKQMGTDYTAEYPLALTVPVTYEGNAFSLVIEGRADGVIEHSQMEDEVGVTIDEIKGVYMDVSQMEGPFSVHLAQAKCYAYMYATLNKQAKMGITMTYCNLESELMRVFPSTFEYEELDSWFQGLVKDYAKWANFQIQWRKERNASLKQVVFPFPYRNGQKKLVTGVYQTILREKRLYIEAPTGVGKTISTVFPTVKAMGEGVVSKIFYLTAKTITRTVAEQAFRILKEEGAKVKVVTLTAKDKICAMEEMVCNPDTCERAKGHYDRINDAVYDMITNEFEISRDVIELYAMKYKVCPFEMALDATLWVDAIVCDYNYVFDPKVYLRRFFVNEKKEDYVFLVDEAHNLVDRAREMYSATLVKEQLLEVKRIVTGKSRKLVKQLEICNKEMLKWKRECESYLILEDIDAFSMHLMRLATEYYEFLREYPEFDGREEVVGFYFELTHFLNMFELCDSKYQIYVENRNKGEFSLTLQCMDPSTNLEGCLQKGRSSIFFSATLLPISYYKEQLAGRVEDYAIYAESIFDVNKRLLLVANDVSTKYTRRTSSEYEKVAQYILAMAEEKVGNYMAFFPSYAYMKEVYERLREALTSGKIHVFCQETSMTEEERDGFLQRFCEEPENSHIGCCVMGGIFSEGIDLKGNRLIGCVIVGTGLPMVCTERELFRQYYDEKKGAGFSYSYLYQGMNKVLQSGGRVIRTEEDEGVILLLDERFLKREYLELFPREWFPYGVVNQKNVRTAIADFWDKRREDE